MRRVLVISAPTARRGLNVALVVLVVLHVVPVPGDPQWIALGFIPWDLAYPLIWILAAALVVLLMTGPAWPDEPPPALVAPPGDASSESESESDSGSESESESGSGSGSGSRAERAP
ncbi:MAG: hypothetical protein AAGF11_30800 [Myxococcota bacterium]